MGNPKIYPASWHDYRSRCIYMITLSKASSAPEFCHLQGDCRIKGGQPGSVSVKLTPLGQIIRKEITAIPDLEPAVRILQFSIMPDHAHILLFVQRYISEALGTIIARFKIKIKEASGIAPVFEENFNDQILTKDRSLSTLFSYIRENPLRLAVRRQFPEYFRRVNNLVIDGISYQAYGNFQLLENPFKKQVIVHRADSDAIIAGNFARWRYTAVNGGVLVSPFISKAEKDVRTQAETVGGRTILIINELMGERYKPVGREFHLCESGRLLIISVGIPGPLSRQTCLSMNLLAQKIAVGKL